MGVGGGGEGGGGRCYFSHSCGAFCISILYYACFICVDPSSAAEMLLLEGVFMY